MKMSSNSNHLVKKLCHFRRLIRPAIIKIWRQDKQQIQITATYINCINYINCILCIKLNFGYLKKCLITKTKESQTANSNKLICTSLEKNILPVLNDTR